MKKKHLVIVLLLAAIGVSGIWWMQHKKAVAPGNKTQSGSFEKTQHSLIDPTSLWVIVNKRCALQPKDYAPADLVVPNVSLRSTITAEEKQLRKSAATALQAMDIEAKKAGLHFTLQSGYRSYDFQEALYNRYVTQQGKATADAQSARPGHSEHQTGLALDLGSATQPECDIEACFGQTPEGTWLAKHAAEYGFIIRYTAGDEDTTGYIAEPWHLRYVGRNLALEMQKQHTTTLEQFFGTGNAPDYE